MTKQIYGYIYKTTNKVNGRYYIGKHQRPTFDPKYYGSGKLIKQALQKYGKHNFHIAVLEYCSTKEELNAAERKHIAIHKHNNIYNITDGGDGINSELAQQLARNRWKDTTLNDRQEHMRPAREAYEQKVNSGTLNRVQCQECNGPLNSHKSYCSNYNRHYTPCPDCNAKQGHFRQCPQFIPKYRSEKTKKLLSSIASNRDENHKLKISKTLKTQWENGYYAHTTCDECNGKSHNHKSTCSRAPSCTECDTKGYSHRKTCPYYKPLKEYYCEVCNKLIKNPGNYRQHLKSKQHLSKLNK